MYAAEYSEVQENIISWSCFQRKVIQNPATDNDGKGWGELNYSDTLFKTTCLGFYLPETLEKKILSLFNITIHIDKNIQTTTPIYCELCEESSFHRELYYL